jgi:hypothetical protein
MTEITSTMTILKLERENPPTATSATASKYSLYHKDDYRTATDGSRKHAVLGGQDGSDDVRDEDHPEYLHDSSCASHRLLLLFYRRSA